MNGMMNENVFVKEYEFDEALIQKIHCIINDWVRDCHNKYFQTFLHICVYDIKLAKLGNNEIINFTISGKRMNLYEINKKITVARQNGFLFNQIIQSNNKIYSNRSQIKVHYYLKLRIPIMRRHFFKKLPQNPEYIQTHCNDRRNPFHFAYRQWYIYINPQY